MAGPWHTTVMLRCNEEEKNMKRLFASVVACSLLVLATSCGNTPKSDTAGLPEGITSQRELRDMKDNPQDYTPEQLKAAGLDPSLGTPRDPADTPPPAAE